jgi:PAS domain S-box-containing protein
MPDVPDDCAAEELAKLRARVAELERAEAARAQDIVARRTLGSTIRTLTTADATSFDAIVDRALRELGEALGVDRAYLFLASRDLASIDNTHEWCAPGVEPQIERSHGLPIEAFPWLMPRLARLETVVIDDVAGLPAEAGSERAILEAQQIRACLLAPVAVGTRAIGFVGFDDVRGPRAWSEPDRITLCALGDLIASAHRQQCSASDWSKLVGCVLAFGDDAAANVSRLTALAGDVLGATAAAYSVRAGDKLRSCARWNAPPELPDEVDLAGRLCVSVLDGGTDELIVLRDLQRSAWAESDPSVRGVQLHTYVGRPVLVDGAIVGSLAVVFQRDFVPNEEEGRFLAAIANAITVEEARRRSQERLRESEDALRHSHALLEATLESTADGVLAADRDGNYLRWNRKFESMWGMPAAIRGPDGRDVGLRHAAGETTDPEGFSTRIRDLRSDAETESFDRVQLRDGRVFETFTIPLRVDGARAGRVYSFRDVTARARIEASHAMLATAVQQAGEAILIADPHGGVVYANPMFERMTGWTLGDVADDAWTRLGLVDLERVREDVLSALRDGNGWTGSVEARRKDGTSLRADTVVAKVHDETGKVVNFVAVARDVTREHQLEIEMRQAQKMEAVGRLAGGVAHDFNNLLTAIVGYTDLILGDLRADDPLRDDVQEIRRAADRAATLTRQLLAFSRRQVLSPKVLDLNEVLRGTEKLLRRLIGEDIAFRVYAARDLCCVKADPGQIEQVIVNLAVNARDAMPDGGVLTVSTANFELGSATVFGHETLPAGRYAELRIADSGIGMDAETLQRIFEPFFTTKEQGKGTGLGLSTAYGIVRQSGGVITAESRPGAGATFRILFPATYEVRESEPPASTHAPRGPATGTLLLAEDEDAVRRVLAKMLRDRGYDVLEASDGVEALAIAGAREAPIDLLVTDVVMPRMGGIELADRLRELRPRTPVLFMSGHTGRTDLAEQLPRDAEFLQKPFVPATMLAKVRDLLGGVLRPR